MRPEAFEDVQTTSERDALPLRSVQQSAVGSGLLNLTLLTCLAAAVVLPQIGFAAYALNSPEIRQAIFVRPLVAFQLTLALLFWIGLFAWPLKGLFNRLAWRRLIEITPETVSVTDERTFGSGAWTAPLGTYKGIAHHVRASLSGNRHELILVHPEAECSVLLLTAEHISEIDISRMTRMLGVPQVSATELYMRLGANPVAARGGSWQSALA